MPGIYERIVKFNESLLPDMVKFKYEAMAENIFRFYRGTCHLFYEDLAQNDNLPPAPITWICGDLHIENFGSYKGDNHLVYFDLNDFDEGILAPASWELARMLTSIFIAFDSLDIEEEKALIIAQMFLKNYSAILTGGKPKAIDPRTAKGIVCDFLTAVAKRKQKDLLKKRTELKKKKKLVLYVKHEKHFEIDKPLKKELVHHISEWINHSSNAPYNYKVINCLFRLAGTGSVGVKRYMFLLKNLDIKNRYFLLDMKQAKASSLQPYTTVKQPKWASEAERVTHIQQRMQNTLPAFLNTTIFKGDPYVLQHMQPTEDRINFELIKNDSGDICQVIDDMALLTASAQLRSGGRQGSAIADEMIAFGQDNKWHLPILKYAANYAKQVKNDYREFMKGYRDGRYDSP